MKLDAPTGKRIQFSIHLYFFIINWFIQRIYFLQQCLYGLTRTNGLATSFRPAVFPFGRKYVRIHFEIELHFIVGLEIRFLFLLNWLNW